MNCRASPDSTEVQGNITEPLCWGPPPAPKPPRATAWSHSLRVGRRPPTATLPSWIYSLSMWKVEGGTSASPRSACGARLQRAARASAPTGGTGGQA